MPASEMNWLWIGLALTGPALVSVAIALPFWLKGTPMTGAIIGTGMLAVATVAFIGREYIELERFNQQCRQLLQAHIVCRAPYPEAFTRFCIYLFIGLIQSFALFLWSLSLEERKRRRDYALEWQSPRH